METRKHKIYTSLCIGLWHLQEERELSAILALYKRVASVHVQF